MKNIFIVDYGLGNIHSAKHSIKNIIGELGLLADVAIIKDSKDVNKATHIVLPGQGAFHSCMEGLKKIPGMIEELSENVLIRKKPFLGICVGMQLLADKSYENGEHNGLGWIEGKIKKININNLKLPHMGWNEARIIKKNKLIKEQSADYYFVHSYYFDCFLKENEVAITNYGFNFTSMVSKENIFGVQFHPEKSSLQGLKILKNFINL